MIYCSLYARRASCLATVLAAFMAIAAHPAAQAQTQADRDLVAKARSHYLLGPIPGSISCDVTLDWDKFFAAMKVEQTDAVKARIAPLKLMQITVVSTDATHTNVTVSGADTKAAQLADGLKQQLQGFFQIYWSFAYGRLLPSDKDQFVLTSGSDGYDIALKTGANTAIIHMDPTFAVTHSAAGMPQMDADITSEFKPGDDKLLRMRRVHELVNMGASTRMELQLDVDYQTAGKFEVPQHVSLAVPGAYTFDYSLTNCKADPLAPPIGAPTTKQ